jgi:RNA polymerase sigma-70 factor (ECF subfamily)
MTATRLEQHRRALTAYCYRMLGSPFEAEDAVQETLVRAWRAFDTYDDTRAPLRSWLYSIATNICLDMTRSPQRRARAMDLAPAAVPGAPLGEPRAETLWVQPIPHVRVLPDGDPAEVAEARETVQLAFVATLQHLPPRQRAVLILRDVLCWSAAEVANLLDTTVAAVNSGLQRARLTMGGEPSGERVVDRQLLERYVQAFERYDIDALVSLLHEDATMSMPPFAWWLRGRDDIEAVLRAADAPCAGTRLGQVGGESVFGQYRPESGELRPFALVVVETRGGLISSTTTYLGDRLFSLYDLPMSLPTPSRTTG